MANVGSYLELSIFHWEPGKQHKLDSFFFAKKYWDVSFFSVLFCFLVGHGGVPHPMGMGIEPAHSNSKKGQ